MIRPDCLYTKHEAMAGLGLAKTSNTTFRKLRVTPVGGAVQNGNTNYYMGVDIIAAIHRNRGSVPPRFACVQQELAEH